MSFKNVNEITAYQIALELNRAAYPIISKIKHFSYRDQLIRCTLSIPSNIAEGFYRGTDGDFVRFLRYARGSAGECITQLNLAIDNKLIPESKGLDLIKKADRISSMLYSLIRSIELH
jgi:four helix bundle protein